MFRVRPACSDDTGIGEHAPHYKGRRLQRHSISNWQWAIIWPEAKLFFVWVATV